MWSYLYFFQISSADFIIICASIGNNWARLGSSYSLTAEVEGSRSQIQNSPMLWREIKRIKKSEKTQGRSQFS